MRRIIELFFPPKDPKPTPSDRVRVRTYDANWNELDNVVASLRTPDGYAAIPAEGIVAIVRAFEVRGTNCENAANLLLLYTAPLLHFRPDLADELLPGPIEPLYMLGLSDPDQVIAWARWLATDPLTKEQYSDLFYPESVTWLLEQLPEHSDAILRAIRVHASG